MDTGFSQQTILNPLSHLCLNCKKIMRHASVGYIRSPRVICANERSQPCVPQSACNLAKYLRAAVYQEIASLSRATFPQYVDRGRGGGGRGTRGKVHRRVRRH